jgi:hypothetical protein
MINEISETRVVTTDLESTAEDLVARYRRPETAD